MDWSRQLFTVLTDGRPGKWLRCDVPMPVDASASADARSLERFARLFNAVPLQSDDGTFEPSANLVDATYLNLVPPLSGPASGLEPMPAADPAALTAAVIRARKLVEDSLRDSVTTPGMEWLVIELDPPAMSAMTVTTTSIPIASKPGATIHAQYGTINVRRPWLDTALLARKDWYWRGHLKGDLTGTSDAPGQLQPVCISMIVLWAAYLQDGATRSTLQEPGWSALGYGAVDLPPCPPNDDPSLSQNRRQTLSLPGAKHLLEGHVG